jgi:hypothetical protein
MTEKTKNKIFWTIFILLIVGSVVATYLRIYVWKDYQIVAQTSCNPQTEESCFVQKTDTATTTESGEEATATEISYYKLISKKAANVYACEQTTEKMDCNEELTCLENEANCSYEYCTSDQEDPENGVSCYVK